MKFQFQTITPCKRFKCFLNNTSSVLLATEMSLDFKGLQRFLFLRHACQYFFVLLVESKESVY